MCRPTGIQTVAGSILGPATYLQETIPVLPVIQVGQWSVNHEIMDTYFSFYRFGSLPRNRVDRLTDRLDMTLIVFNGP